MKLMVCHDGSAASQEALEKTLDLFKHFKPEVMIITVVEPPLDATSEEEETFTKWKAKREEDLNEAAKWVAEHGCDADAILAVGDPRKMIVEAVEKKNPDLLVVAKRGAGVLGGMVLGSVSAYLIRHSPCPVLVTH